VQENFAAKAGPKGEYNLKINITGSSALPITNIIITYPTTTTYNYHTLSLHFSKIEIC
jgi:hypothetical protein